jgi:hypothetical protein
MLERALLWRMEPTGCLRVMGFVMLRWAGSLDFSTRNARHIRRGSHPILEEVFSILDARIC